jgi:porin
MCDHQRVYLVGHAGRCGEKTVGQPQRPGGQRWGCRMRTAVMAVCLLLRWYSQVAAQVPSLSLSHPAAPDGEALRASAPAQDTTAVPLRPLIDGWGRLRAQLIDQGIQPALIYDGAVFADLAGGLRQGATYLGTAHLQLTVDMSRLLGWPGATLFLDGLSTHGGHPSRFAGDAQGVSSLEAPARWTLEEGWIEQNLFGNQLSLLVGRYDLNSEFYRLHSASLFLNSSFGIGPELAQSGQGGPSIFPHTSVGTRLAFKPGQSVVLRAAILDGVPVNRPGGMAIFARGDGVLLVGEAAYLIRPSHTQQPPRSPRFRIGRLAGLSPYTGKVALGGWHYAAQFADLSHTNPTGQPVQHQGSSGLYVLADQTVYVDRQHPTRRLTLFSQLGLGDGRVNRFGGYTGAGFVLSGPLVTRTSDELGVAVAAAYNSAHFIDQQRTMGTRVKDVEMALEGTYLIQLTPWLAMQPDVQYVLHPNTDPAISHALVALLRFELSF